MNQPDPNDLAALRQAVRRDPLTGVANRLELAVRLDAAITNFRSDGSTFAVLFADVDFFKRINDRHGHVAGDRALIALAHFLQQECRDADLIARYGGDEFLVVRSPADKATAIGLAERLRTSVENAAVSSEMETRLTISIGAAVAEAGDTVDSLLRRTDQALYRAKHSGRNRCCLLTAAELNEPPTVPSNSDQFPNEPGEFSLRVEPPNAPAAILNVLGWLVREAGAIVNDLDASHAELVLRRSLRGDSSPGPDDRPSAVLTLDFPNGISHGDIAKPAFVQLTLHPLDSAGQSDSFQVWARDILRRVRSQFERAE